MHKHIVVIALIALGVMVDRFIRRVGDATSDSARGSALRRLNLSAEGATGVGAVIVLLTVAAQFAT